MYCKRCRVHISGNKYECPLCHKLLSDQEAVTENVFPPITAKKRAKYSFFRMTNYAGLSLIVAALLFFLLLPEYRFWTIIFSVNTFFIWLSIASGIYFGRNILNNVFTQFVLTSLFYLFFDIFTGFHGWFFTVELPFYAVINIILCLVVAAAWKKDTEKLFIFLFLICLIGVVPMIVMLSQVIAFSIFPIISSVFCLIFLIGIFFYKGAASKSELERFFHL